ncbi:MAG: 4-phosphoerythronate dehydrogenase PdxB [Congregibacter sp.]
MIRLLADENIQGLDLLAPFDVQVQTVPGRELRREDLTAVDALWVRSVTRVDETLLHGSGLRFVGTATAGTEHIDVDYLKAAKVAFAAAPGANANAVVEYVIAALLDLQVPWHALEEGGSFGIIGYGHVGQRLATLAPAMGWSVRVSDPWLDVVTRDHSAHAKLEFCRLEEVLQCDVVSFHCDLHQRAPWPSYHLIGPRELAGLRAGQYLINASRGEVIDNQALLEHLAHPLGANFVLDVWENEPDFDARLLRSSRLRTATPHIAGYSHDAKLAATRLLIEAMQEVGLLTQHTNAEPENSISSSVNRLEPVSDDSAFAWAQALMRHSYDIQIDDKAMRSIAEQSQPGTAFDQLRKNYRQRRELRGQRFTTPVITEALQRVADAFGVQISGQ